MLKYGKEKSCQIKKKTKCRLKNGKQKLVLKDKEKLC